MAGCVSSKDSKGDKKRERHFPDNLSGFGYEFKDGKLRSMQTGEPFQFVVREGDQSYNQRHYEALGEVITEEVYNLLETECNLERRPVPFDYNENDPEPHTFIFVSSDAVTNPDKLLVLIHGSGVVRAGQWARRLIINDSIDSGTQVPFIKRAQSEGYGIVVMNTNDNRRENRNGSSRIRGSENPENHAAHVWEYYIKNAKAKHIALIAHSYGGCVTTALFQKEKEDFKDRVFAVAMTDSVHYISNTRAFKDLVKVSCNWVSSTKPLDTVLNSMPGDIKRVSAGVNVHEQTSWSSFHSVFKFLQQRYDAVARGADAEADEGVEEGDSTAALERSMSVGSDSALENTDVDMTEIVGDDDSISKGEELDSTPEGEKMTVEGSAEEGKEPNEGEKMAVEVSNEEGKEPNEGEKMTVEGSAEEGKEPNEGEKMAVEVSNEEGKEPNEGEKKTVEVSTEEGKVPSEGEKKTVEGSTAEGKLPNEKVEKGDKSPEGKDITKDSTSSDAKTTEEKGDETLKSTKDEVKTEEQNPTDVKMLALDTKGAHSISDSEEEEEEKEQGNEQKKKKKEK